MYSMVAVSAELAEQLVAIETGGADAVHQARTRVRRLRSILGVYRKAFDREQAKRLRGRLKTLGAELGRVRDLEVRITSVEDLLDVDSAPDVVDAVERLASELAAEHDAALRSLLAHLRSRPHRQLVADVQAFSAAPPVSKAGAEHPRRVARKALHKARRRVLADRGDTLEQRHELRKAARQFRYAADAVADDFGRPAVRLATAGKALQDALGDHRDLVLLAAFLRERTQGRELSASARAGIARLAAEAERRGEEGLGAVADHLEVVSETVVG